MELLPSNVEEKTFNVARKGYNREEVREFLRGVGWEIVGLSERATIAAVRADQLEREILEVRQSADKVAGAYHEALEARHKLLADAEAEAAQIRAAANGDEAIPVPTRPQMTEQQASIEAQQILAEAREQAHRKEAAADAVLQRALAASERVETETQEIFAEARAEVDEMRAEAERDGERIRSEASRSATERHGALEDEKRDLLRRVRDLQAALTDLEEQKTRDGASASEAKPKPEKKAKFRDVAASAANNGDKNITVDLTGAADETQSEPEPASVAAKAKPSRYTTRSANLPHIGEGASSVLGDMNSLRRKD